MISKKYIPNIITSIRIILTPIFVYFILGDIAHGKLIAGVIFFIASLSDAIDGKIARKFGVVTKFGIYFDPLADKFLVLFEFKILNNVLILCDCASSLLDSAFFNLFFTKIENAFQLTTPKIRITKIFVIL